MKKVYSLIAKALSILYIIFLTIFAFDEPILSMGFLIHLIPSAIFLAFLLISIRHKKIGGTLFFLLGIATIFFFKTYGEIMSFITISLVPIIIGILFYISKKH